MKRLFAFKTIKQLLKDSSEGSKDQAKMMALENNFVTDLTSLVVTKETNIIKPIVAPYNTFGQQNRDMYGLAAPTSLNIAKYHFSPRPGRAGGRSRGKVSSSNIFSKTSQIYALQDLSFDSDVVSTSLMHSNRNYNNGYNEQHIVQASFTPTSTTTTTTGKSI